MTGCRDRIVVLGIMSRMPVGGLVWGTIQYLLGFARLGYDVYYVEEHGSTPRMFIDHPDDDGWLKAAAFVDGVMRRIGMADRWAYHVLHDDRCYGMSRTQLQELCASAAYVINLHGSTTPMAHHESAGVFVYVDTDPVEIQIGIHENARQAIDFLGAHDAFFTWGLNYGAPDCRVPVSDQFCFHPSPPPVVTDLWKSAVDPSKGLFTTIGNWRQDYREFEFQGETYYWSKHREFLKFIDLPRRAGPQFELALSSCDDDDRRLLETHAWRVRNALPFSADLDQYRDYIRESCGEFTVAKDQNVRLRSGWFSERSASYLAAGRPVITQDTGFGSVLPTGTGLFAFTTIEEVIDAVRRIRGDYATHSRAARDIAAGFFDYRLVLPRLLAQASGERRPARPEDQAWLSV
jgi:hypothetical protein